MKKVIFILVLALCLPLNGTDFTVTVTVATPIAADVLATVTAWRIRQLNEDGTLKFANNNALGEAVLTDALRRIIKDQCEFSPASCPPSIKTHLDNKNSSDTSFQSGIDAAVVQ